METVFYCLSAAECGTKCRDCKYCRRRSQPVEPNGAAKPQRNVRRRNNRDERRRRDCSEEQNYAPRQRTCQKRIMTIRAQRNGVMKLVVTTKQMTGCQISFGGVANDTYPSGSLFSEKVRMYAKARNETSCDDNNDTRRRTETNYDDTRRRNETSCDDDANTDSDSSSSRPVPNQSQYERVADELTRLLRVNDDILYFHADDWFAPSVINDTIRQRLLVHRGMNECCEVACMPELRLQRPEGMTEPAKLRIPRYVHGMPNRVPYISVGDLPNGTEIRQQKLVIPWKNEQLTNVKCFRRLMNEPKTKDETDKTSDDRIGNRAFFFNYVYEVLTALYNETCDSQLHWPSNILGLTKAVQTFAYWLLFGDRPCYYTNRPERVADYIKSLLQKAPSLLWLAFGRESLKATASERRSLLAEANSALRQFALPYGVCLHFPKDCVEDPMYWPEFTISDDKTRLRTYDPETYMPVIAPNVYIARELKSLGEAVPEGVTRSETVEPSGQYVTRKEFLDKTFSLGETCADSTMKQITGCQISFGGVNNDIIRIQADHTGLAKRVAQCERTLDEVRETQSPDGLFQQRLEWCGSHVQDLWGKVLDFENVHAGFASLCGD